MSKKTNLDKKDDKKSTALKEDKPKFDEIIFSNLAKPQLTFDRTGYTFTNLLMDVF